MQGVKGDTAVPEKNITVKYIIIFYLKLTTFFHIYYYSSSRFKLKLTMFLFLNYYDKILGDLKKHVIMVTANKFQI